MNALTQNVAGGMIGAMIYEAIHFLVAQPGCYIVSVLFIVGGAVMFFHLDLEMIADSFSAVGRHLMVLGDHLRSEKEEWKERYQSEKEALQAKRAREAEDKENHSEEEWEPQNEMNDELSSFVYDDLSEEAIPDIPIEEPIAKEVAPVESQVVAPEEPVVPMAIQDDSDYVLPLVTLLNNVKHNDQSQEKRSVEKKRRLLEQTFQSFGVDAKVESCHVGPSITKFEVKLAVGVKVNKIVHLADDIALALAAKDVRIEAPIPGKSLIGIEVPNQTISMVGFRDVIEGAAEPHSILSVPLGKDISGDVIMCDLASMPHLLIAGSTGSGKSVCINDIITSLLMQAKPSEVKLMMIDPKMVELSMYNGIPHLVTPVVTDAKKASQALHKAVEEMERRYQLFAQVNVRNIQGYNQYIQKVNQEEGTEQATMPLMVIIVDELADLMMVASKEVEDSIIRLAQKARAAGIHMILATQRPSVNVITGLIKANVPSRIAFAVPSGGR